MTHDAWLDLVTGLLGAPFKWGARGPDAYDCWGLVLAVRRSIGMVVPAIWDTWNTATPDSHVEACALMEAQVALSPAGWVKEGGPSDGAIVAMSAHKKIHHVGVWTPYGVLDTTRDLGVTISSPARLREIGYKRVEFYRWVG